jgi:hypothetical protein
VLTGEIDTFGIDFSFIIPQILSPIRSGSFCDQVIGDTQRENNRRDGEYGVRCDRVRVENNHLSGNGHQRRGQHQLKGQNLRAEIESDIDKDFYGDEYRHKRAKGLKDVIDIEEKIWRCVQSLVQNIDNIPDSPDNHQDHQDSQNPNKSSYDSVQELYERILMFLRDFFMNERMVIFFFVHVAPFSFRIQTASEPMGFGILLAKSPVG